MIKQDMNAFRIPEPAPTAPPQARPPATSPGPAARQAPFRPAAYPPPPPRAEQPAPATIPAQPSALRILRSRWKLITGVMALSLTLCLLVILQFTPVYQASAVIEVDENTAGLAQPVDILKSWALAEKVILKLNLTRDPEINTALTRRSFYRLSTWFEPAPARERIVVPPGSGTFTLKPPLLAAFAARLEVAPAGGNTIRITFSSEDPAKAARIANAVAAQLPLEAPRSTASSAAGSAVELAQLSEELRQSQQALEEHRTSMAEQGPAQRITVSDPQREASLTVARRRLAALEARHRKVSDLLRNGAGIETVAAVLDESEIDGLHQQQMDLARREEELAAMYGTAHPETAALQQERQLLAARIQQAIRRASDGIASEVKEARRALQALAQQLPASVPQGDPAAGAQRLAELEAKVQQDRTRYETMLTRSLNGEVAGAAGMGGVKLATPAVAPDAPVFPNQPIAMGLSLLGSSALALGLAYRRGPLRGGIRRAADIGRAVKLANLASVPERARSGRLADSILDEPHGAVTASLRSLQATVSDAMHHAGVGVLAVTSAGQGAGTTSLAVSLARLAAREAAPDGGRVLLIDADFRRADLAAHFASGGYLQAAPPADGLVEVLSGECDLAHAICRDPQSPLEYLPIAAPSANPASLLATQSMRRLVEALRQHYTLVIINTPSVQAYPDACRLASVADTFLLVVNWDETQRDVLADSVKRLRDAGASVSGTVLNRCGRRAAPRVERQQPHL